MKKRIFSIMAAFALLICMVVTPQISTLASEKVDGSYLTEDNFSSGSS